MKKKDMDMDSSSIVDSASYNDYQGRQWLRGLMLWTAGCVVISWALGASGLSVAWLLLLIAAALAKWNSKLQEITRLATWEEAMRIRKRQVAGAETVEWFNLLLSKWWRISGDTIFQLVKDKFQPLLDESKPKFVDGIELEQLTLGDQAPVLQNVRGFELGSIRSQQQQKVTLEVQVLLNSEEFRMVLRARLFGKGMGVDVDVAVERFYICGKLALTFSMDVASPFPHFSNISVSFVEKPDVWFSIRVLKSLQMMEIPVLKTWLHSAVLDGLESALVDPGHLSFSLSGVRPDAPSPDVETDRGFSQGVLLVTVSSAAENAMDGDPKWLVLRVNGQAWKSSFISSGWLESPSFLVSSLQKDSLVVKIKSKRLVSSVTLSQYNMNLDQYNLETTQSVETHLQKQQPRVNQVPSIVIRLEFVPLPSINLDQPLLYPPSDTCCGVLTVYIHKAEGLSTGGSCNPYCVVFTNRRKVKSTQYVSQTSAPEWDTHCQILVHDYTQATLSFIVCSWNPKKMTDDEMLGVAVLNLAQGDVWVVNQELSLSGSPNATLKVSVVFQPVPRMGGEGGDMSPELDLERKRNSTSSWMSQAKNLLGRTEQDVRSGGDISDILTAGAGLMEVTLLRARDLVAMDMNGFSDPYCELKVNNECKYKSNIKKKTLNPIWNENAIMGMPRSGQTFDVMVWDHDTFGMKDFLGSAVFTLEEVRVLSINGEPVWRPLQGVRSGELQIRIKIISDNAQLQEVSTTSWSGQVSAEASPVPRRAGLERSRVRLGVQVPPPTPPRTVSIPPTLTLNGSPCLSQISSRISANGSPCQSQASSRLTVSSLPPSPVNDEPLTAATAPAKSGLRSIRLKVSRSLRLRRFKSEVNVRGSNNEHSNSNDHLRVCEPVLNHASSQPNVSGPVSRPTELKLNGAASSCDETLRGVQGKVLQAQGLHVSHVAQIFCRIKLIGLSRREREKTIAKGHLLPAEPNPQFQLDFELSSPEEVPRKSTLLFEILSAGKEVLALRRITLQDLMAGDSKESHTWLALNNGATLEVSIAHDRIIKKKTKKLFRSWSVHRIGKV